MRKADNFSCIINISSGLTIGGSGFRAVHLDPHLRQNRKRSIMDALKLFFRQRLKGLHGIYDVLKFCLFNNGGRFC